MYHHEHRHGLLMPWLAKSSNSKASTCRDLTEFIGLRINAGSIRLGMFCCDACPEPSVLEQFCLALEAKVIRDYKEGKLALNYKR